MLKYIYWNCITTDSNLNSSDAENSTQLLSSWIINANKFCVVRLLKKWINCIVWACLIYKKIKIKKCVLNSWYFKISHAWFSMHFIQNISCIFSISNFHLADYLFGLISKKCRLDKLSYTFSLSFSHTFCAFLVF